MRIILTAGGTGGHIMPAVAIAEALRARDPEVKILFIGTDRGLEERIARQYELDFAAVTAMGVKGKRPADIFKAVGVNLKAFRAAKKLVREFEPDWVVGTGGYVTGMVVLAGRLFGAQTAIHEQNSVPGLTNRILGKLARRIYLAFPDKLGKLPAKKCRLVGNPVRAAIKTAPSGGAKLLIMGGSLGASSINKAAVEAVRLLREAGQTIEIIHQTGERDIDFVQASYKDLSGVTAAAFIADMAAIYAQTKLCVTRAGGLSLAELSRLGLPSIMVPFPHATDDHQSANAAYVAEAGGGLIIKDSELSGEILAKTIAKLLENEDELKRVSQAMRAVGLGDGAESIAEEILSV